MYYVSPHFLVKEFHETYGVPAPRDIEPQIIAEREELRRKLITEEFKEVIEAFDAGDVENLAKELSDLIYVVYGTAIEFGIPLDDVLAEVHNSNMSKLGPDGLPIYREDGKVLKGPDYYEPDVASILWP